MFSQIQYNTGEKLPGEFRLESQQLFISRLMSPENNQKIIFAKHVPGSGKTIAALSAALSYLKLFQKYPQDEPVNVIIIGFQKSTFMNEIINRPGLGFVSQNDYNYLMSLKNVDELKHNRFLSYLKSSIKNLKFFGYQELHNFIFKNEKLNNNSMKLFDRCFIICDEIHNVYNSVETNNYGLAIKHIFNHKSVFMKAILMSATPINNKPSEIVDLINLIRGTNFEYFDFFHEEKLKPGALEKIRKLCAGYFSFYINEDPRFMPNWCFTGNKVKNIPFLKFHECVPSKLQEKFIDKCSNAIENYGVNDAILPIAERSFGFTQSDFESIKMQPIEWKNKNMINYDGYISGNILREENLKRFSGKYSQMMIDLKKVEDKLIIYHDYVNGTGAKLIQQILIFNGYLLDGTITSDESICFDCRKQSKNHDKTHEFIPIRFAVLTGEMDKKLLRKTLDKFNAYDNLYGRQLKIIIGSRVIKEGMNFMAVRNLWIMYPPDSVSSFLQLMGRPIRKNSHVWFPEKKRSVEFRIYVQTKNELINWARKMENYTVIREIEKVLNEEAIDGSIYYDLIKNSFIGNDRIGILPFKVKKSLIKNNYSEVFYKNWEIEEIKKLIKGFFAKSPVWNYKDLWESVKNPPFVHYVNAKLFKEDNFILALGDLITDKERIVLRNVDCVINLLDDYFIAFPINHTEEKPISGLGINLEDSKGKIQKDYFSWITHKFVNNKITVNITYDLQKTNTTYEDMKLNFYEKYSSASIHELSMSLEIYGEKFHERLIMDCISYIYNLLIGSGKRSEFHMFYFKLINLYNSLGVVVFADTAPEKFKHIYEKFTEKVDYSDLPKYKVISTSSVASFNSSDIEVFLKSFKKKIPANLLPIGFINKEIIKLYSGQWFETNYIKLANEGVENNIVVGYYEATGKSFEMQFKIRTPNHKLEKNNDARKNERGMVCYSKNKEELHEICEQLGLEKLKTNKEICEIIKKELIYRELKDRLKFKSGQINSRTIWFYFPVEKFN